MYGIGMSSDLTVQEAAERTGVSAHTLRYYEREGLIPSVPRASSGHRRYGELELDWIRFVSRLRDTGMAIGEIRRYTSLVLAGSGTLAERIDLLEAHRARLARDIAALQESGALLESKIAGYRARLATPDDGDNALRGSPLSAKAAD
jgi:DNA-binding transcriptional MerR regulator